MREKFTPKPWYRKGKRVYWKNPDKDLPRGTLPNGLICTCKSAEDWPECDEEARANADLITAAPEMYEQLDFFLDTLKKQFPERGAIIEKILKKARGEK